MVSRRALAIVFAALIGAPLAFMAVGLVLPGELIVERTTEVPVAPEVAFAHLDSTTQWASYHRRDRTVGDLNFEVTGLERGVGSGLQYYAGGQLVATFKILRADSPTLIEYGFSWEGAPIRGRGVFLLEPVNGGTRVTRREVATIGPDPVFRWMALLGTEAQIGEHFESFFDEFRAQLTRAD